MPLATNPLLQTASAASAKAAATDALTKAPEASKDTSSHFAQVYAKQSTPGASKVAKADNPPLKPSLEKQAAVASNKPEGDKDTAADKPSVADSGKNLPANKSTKAGKTSSHTSSDDSTVKPADAAPQPTVDPQPTVAVDPAATQQPAPAAEVALVVPPPVTESFDPATDDPLAGLPMIRMALEQNAKAQGTTSAHATSSNDKGADASGEVSTDQRFASGLAAMVEQQKPAGSDGEPDAKAFAGQIEAGLKDAGKAAGDTRIDDFANRLSGLTEAPTPKSANVVSPPAQPLVMSQSGWSEGLVNRVMYMSSQNLKSADIQLTPAELGRLDIRVNMTPDQQTQVVFTSAHVGVREALESQQGRLRDMFAEQGMGQLDVSVSDQSRQSQNQQQAQQGQRTSRASAGSEGADAVTPVAEASNVQRVVIGSSVVDYYA